MKRALRLPLAILAILLFGIVGVVLVRVLADGSHSVTLTWTPPAPKAGSTVVGYNVYRCETAGNYDLLATRVPAPPYVDSNVKRGKTYRYFVRTLDSTGHESPPSNQVEAQIQ